MSSCETHFFLLVPHGKGKEALKTVSVHNGQEVFLGRNELTGLVNSNVKNFLFVSRNQAKIRVIDFKIFITPTSRTPGLVYIDGYPSPQDVETEIFVGQKISLLGQSNYFNFQIMSVNDHRPDQKQPSINPNSEINNKRKIDSILDSSRDSDPLDLSAERSDHSNSEIYSEDVIRTVPDSNRYDINVDRLASISECAICLLSMALPHTSVPCGHAFCYSCINDWIKKSKDCPSCKTPNQLLSPALYITDTIREILSKDPKALEEWEVRCASAAELKKAQNTESNTNNRRSSLQPSNPLPAHRSVTVGSSASLVSSSSTAARFALPPFAATIQSSLAQRSINAGRSMPLQPVSGSGSGQSRPGGSSHTMIFIDDEINNVPSITIKNRAILDLTED